MISVLRNRSGTTLVELLVSLALLSVMAIYAVQSLTFLKQIDRVKNRMEAQMEVEAVAQYMRGAIADARIQNTIDAQGARQDSFAGTESQLQFVTAFNGNGERGGLYGVAFHLNNENELIANHTLLRQKNQTGAQPVVLMRGVSKLRFSYLSADSELTAAAASWSQPDALPAAVLIEIEFVGQGGRRWPLTLVQVVTAG